MAPTAAPFDRNIIHPDDYARHGYPHEVWSWMRREDPVSWWDRTQGVPFWAITKHADVIELSKQPERFLSGPRLTLTHLPERRSDEFPMTLIQMDPPKHGIFRQMVSRRFTPQALNRWRPEIERIGKEIVDALVGDGGAGECDFVHEVSAPLPIAVIAWILGVPGSDWRLLFDWTNRVIGAGDPEYQQPGESPNATARAALLELFTYFTELVEARRKSPEDDLITLFTQATYEGKPLELRDVLAWCFLIVVAGNETTRNGTSGGMLAFVEHPEELQRLQKDPSLLSSAVEEVLRWTSPLIHFARTATEDYELRGKRIRAGESVCLFYPSTNRDEEVFEQPFSFRIDRKPNRHLAFGIGEHFCLGSHLARLELSVAYKHLLPRIEWIELAGPVDRLCSSLVGGVKRLPIRYRIRPA